MIDIRGIQVNIGDKILISSKYLGLVLTTLVKESKTHYYFGDNVERLAKYIKTKYVGYDIISISTGLPWVGIPNKDRYGYSNNADQKYVGKGTNGGRYILDDTTNKMQSRVLKVDDNFSL